MILLKSKLWINLTRDIRQFDWSKLNPKNMDRKKFGYAARCMVRPLSGFSDIKYEGAGSLFLANTIFVLLFFIRLIQMTETGYIFNYTNAETVNVFMALATSSLLIPLWAIANWSVCCLMNGEGRFREIWITTAYAFLPKLFFDLPLTLLSRVLTQKEAAIFTFLSAAVTVWCVLLLLSAMLVVHQYTVAKTLASCLLTLCSIVAILFFIVLFFCILQQIVFFAESLYRELRMRS